jgi:hypothetical protein
LLSTAVKFMTRRPMLSAGIGGATLVGGLAGVRSYNNPENKDMELSDHLGKAVGTGGGFAAYTAGGLVAASVAAKAASSKAGLAMGGKATMSGMSGIARAVSRPSGYVPLGGGILGAAIGAHYSDDPEKGALVGAGVGIAGGIAARSAVRAGRTWKKLGKVGQAGAILAVTAGIIGVSKAVMGNPPAEVVSTVSDNDGSGGYSVPDSSLRQRMASMNATGDLAFGLNRLRHG